MSPIERWRNAETGQWYEVEYADAVEAPRAAPEPSQLPDPTLPAIEPSGAVIAALGADPGAHRPPDPRRVRLLARLIRSILEAPDDV